MDIAPGQERFYIAGVRSVIMPWDTDPASKIESIVPPLRRKILFVLKVNNQEQNVVWHKDYANLPDVNEVYSIATTADDQLCVIYGGESLLETAINPLVLRLDGTGETSWYKPVFPPTENALPDFRPNEQIANLDAINVVATSDNSCLLLFITRIVHAESETFRLHLIRYDSQGNINWHKALPTDLYGTTYLLNNGSERGYFIVTTNLSRDAALEAMLLGQPFIPQITVVTINNDGKLLRTIEQSNSLSGAWLNNAIAPTPNSLILIGKKRSAWMAHMQSIGQVVSEYIDNTEDKISDEFQAIANKDSGFIVTHNGLISLFDERLRLQTTLKIADVTNQSYENSNLSSQLPNDLSVEKLLPLNGNDYLLFYKYGSRLAKINLKPVEKTEQQQ
ncbi:hypothetical protein [Kaarinaea lacus]